MANPYASDNLDPFAEDFRRAPPTQQQPQWSAPAVPTPAPTSPSSTAASVSKPSAAQAPPPAPGQPQFYDGPSPSVPYSQPQAPAAPGQPPAPGQGAPPQQPGTTIDPHARSLQTSKFWTMAFYQQFFDIDTKQVLLRMSNTLVPLNPPDFLLDRNWHGAAGSAYSSTQTDQNAEFEEAGVVLNRNPDMYGPFWICTTLWMVLAVVSNIMSRIAYERRQSTKINGTSAPEEAWGYDFHMAMIACVTIYVYCFGMGALVWGLMKWKNLPVSLLDSICLYGYSMFIFLLVAILCMIPVSGLQWLFVILGGCWSSAYLLINFWHVWKVALEREWFIGVVLLVFLFHMGVTMSFKFYFLNYDM